MRKSKMISTTQEQRKHILLSLFPKGSFMTIEKTPDKPAPELINDWNKILLVFPNLDKTPLKQINHYSCLDFQKNIINLIPFFENLIKTNHLAILCNINFAKIFAICFIQVNESLMVCNDKGLFNLHFLRLLSHIGVLLMKVSSEIKNFNMLALFQANFNQLLNLKDSNFAANVVFNLLQLFAILSISFKEPLFEPFFGILKEFIRNKSIESISDCEIQSEEFKELWKSTERPHVKALVVSNLKHFSIIQFNSEASLVSARYISLYYISKLLKADVLKNGEEEHLVQIIDEQKLLLEGEIKSEYILELRLNEAVCCLNIVIRMNNLLLFEKAEFINSLKCLIEKCIILPLKYKLIANCIDGKSFSYKNNHDYVSTAFKFMDWLNRKGLKKNLIVDNMIKEVIEKAITLSNSKEIIFYVVEYFFYNFNTISHNIFIKLLEDRIIPHTSPYSLIEATKENLTPKEENKYDMKDRISKMLMEIFNGIVGSKDKASEDLMEFLINSMKSNAEEVIFGICKLIYCVIKGEMCTDTFFHKEILMSNPIKKYSDINKQNVLKAFLNIKGIIRILDIYLKDKPINVIFSFSLHLISIPLVCQQLLDESFDLLRFLKQQDRKEGINMIYCILNVIKDNPTFVFSKQRTNNSELLLCFFNLIRCTLAEEAGAHTSKVVYLMAPEIILELMNKCEFRFELLDNYLLLLQELLKDNQVTLNHSTIITRNLLSKYIRANINKVICTIIIIDEQGTDFKNSSNHSRGSL